VIVIFNILIMKNLKRVFLILPFLAFAILLSAQNDCKVLVPELSGTYVGKCKKGLANGNGKAVGKDSYEGRFKKGLPNGNGVYTWANGDVYSGFWAFGHREGEGVFKFKYNGNDSVQDGVWKGDIFKGPKPKKPRVVTKRNIDKYAFRLRSKEGTQVEVRVFQGGGDNLNILDYSIIGSSGNSYSSSSAVSSLENVVFPVVVKVTYQTWNKAHTVMLNASIEFEIYEEGIWDVSLYN